MEAIVSGSKETFILDVTDKLGNIGDLTGATPRFDVKDRDGAYMLQNQVPTVVGMQAHCLVDTTVGGNWVPEHYFLYLRFIAAPDNPSLGPMEFKVIP